MNNTERQITFDPKGHFLNNNQCFSPDGQWIVYDTRNDDTKIGSTAQIEMVNVLTGEIKELYHTENQTEFGPGVGAVSFSPKANRVIFIHGIRNADSLNPYTFTRRTGVAIDVDKPGEPLFMDARDVKPPFTPGALRGGTHAHSWSGDGEWISFTYNDYVMEQLSKQDPAFKDLRMVGVMFPKSVEVEEDRDLENNSGSMFSVIVTAVKDDPLPGSDEIDRAFDEGWIGVNGYRRSDGTWQNRALAFQGNVRDEAGNTKTEIFVVDLPDDLTLSNPALPLQGSDNSRPGIPVGVNQKRITKLKYGVQGPRHWLRSTPDGELITFLSKDNTGFINVFAVSPNGGDVKQLTHHKFDVTSGVNISPDGKRLAYTAQNSIFLTDISTGRSERLTAESTDSDGLVGSVIWSPDGTKLIYNRYVKLSSGTFLQIFEITVH